MKSSFLSLRGNCRNEDPLNLNRQDSVCAVPYVYKATYSTIWDDKHSRVYRYLEGILNNTDMQGRILQNVYMKLKTDMNYGPRIQSLPDKAIEVGFEK